MSMLPPDEPAPDGWGHAGWPVDEADARDRAARGLPVYRPAHPMLIDQRPYRRFAAERGANSQ